MTFALGQHLADLRVPGRVGEVVHIVNERLVRMRWANGDEMVFAWQRAEEFLRPVKEEQR
jgi:hypothetical protein